MVRIPSVWLRSMTSRSMRMRSTARRALVCSPVLRTFASRILLASFTCFSSPSICVASCIISLSTSALELTGAGKPSSARLTVVPSPSPLRRCHRPELAARTVDAASSSQPGFCTENSTLAFTMGPMRLSFFSSRFSPLTTASRGFPPPTPATGRSSAPSSALSAPLAPSSASLLRASISRTRPSAGSAAASFSARSPSCTQ
mmetsp:Transcript_23708/g.59633  ORF Transcript_23708/g.59633 Transcript_23708/m.59633 type:complete len:202 (-) Transcript_23708:663-1268(-)